MSSMHQERRLYEIREILFNYYLQGARTYEDLPKAKRIEITSYLCEIDIGWLGEDELEEASGIGTLMRRSLINISFPVPAKQLFLVRKINVYFAQKIEDWYADISGVNEYLNEVLKGNIHE